MEVGRVSNMPSGLIVEAYNNVQTSDIKVNSSTDYNGLALLLACTEGLINASREFIYTFNPHKFYREMQNLNNSKSNINLWA